MQDDLEPSKNSVQILQIDQESALYTNQKTAQKLQQALKEQHIHPSLFSGAFKSNIFAGRYEIDSIIGHGAQGVILGGKDRKTGTAVALKMFHLSQAINWKAAELFEREVQTLKELNHEGIPSFLDMIEDQEQGIKVLVMSKKQGLNLKQQRTQKHTFNEAEIWKILWQMSDILEQLHSHSSQIVHRDIKPSNLIRSQNGQISLVDFGGVSLQQENAHSTIVGTFGYMAPEQLYGEATPATDIYSLAATLIHLMTGIEPENLPRQGLQIDVTAALKTASKPLKNILQKMLAPSPKDRFQDATALKNWLDDLQKNTSKNKSRVVKPEIVEDSPRVDANFNTNSRTNSSFLPAKILKHPALKVFEIIIMFVFFEAILPGILSIIANNSSKRQAQSLHKQRDRMKRMSKNRRENITAHLFSKIQEKEQRRRHQEIFKKSGKSKLKTRKTNKKRR